jgi:signal transduction histidine kinase
MSDLIRHEIIAAAAAAPDIAGVWLFEPIDDAPAPFRPVLVTNADARIDDTSATALEIPADSLLLRWLRVNDVVLPVPDRAGLVESLAPADRDVLARLGIGACVPLVHDAALGGWIGLAPAPDTARLHDEAQRLKQRAPDWAAALNREQQERASTQRSESVRRSNRLTVAGQVAASIAHEVRNPLAAIRAMVQAIRAGDIPPGRHPSMFEGIVSEIDRVTAVLSEVLVLGRDRQPIQERCDLARIARNAADFCDAYARHRDIRIDWSGAMPAPVIGDPDELRQVFVNVILNACQASPAESCVRIETVQEPPNGEGRWSIARVTDTGAGMASDVVARAFDPFFTTRKDGGGLGLAVCREIVDRHGGVIELASTPGQGTTVTIRLRGRVD